MMQDMGMDGRLASRELNENDIPADNIGIEILRGSRELTGRRLQGVIGKLEQKKMSSHISIP